MRRIAFMKKSMRYALPGLLALVCVLGFGCSQQPLQEINAAKAAVDAVVSDGAEKYLPDETRKVYDGLDRALAEVKTQDAKIFRNYARAKEMLHTVISDAEGLAAALPLKKEEAKGEALTAVEDAQAAMARAKELFAQNPDRKHPSGTDETVNTEMKNLEEALQEIQGQIEREDYLTTAARAREIKNKISALSPPVKQLPSKSENKKK